MTMVRKRLSRAQQQRERAHWSTVMAMAKQRDTHRAPTDWNTVKVVARGGDDLIWYERPECDRYGRHGGNVAELIPLAVAAERLEISEAYLHALIVNGIIRMVTLAGGGTARWVPTDDMDDYLYPESVTPRPTLGTATT